MLTTSLLKFHIHREDQASGLPQQQQLSSILLRLTHGETYQKVQPANT